MTELLPCPFCGGQAQILHVSQLWEPKDAYWAQCSNCRMSGKHHYTEEQAIAAWNTRAERTCENESDSGFLCGVCGFGDFGGFHGYEPSYCPNCGAKVVEK